ncbi:MAG: MlaD family protein [Planctomycetota bacterium]
MSHTRQLMLGAFFVIVLGILGYYTLFMTEFSLFKKSYPVVVHFPDASGLRQGDTVRVAGLRQGRVKQAVFDPTKPLEQRITVTLKMDQPLELRQGFMIAIQDSTLLGGKYVLIDPGPADGVPLADYDHLQGTIARNALAALGDLVDENRQGVSSIVAKLDAVVSDLQSGKGTFGRLLSDEELATTVRDGFAKFQRTADNLALLTDDIKAGKGSIGRLFTDEELAKKIGEIGDRLATITRDFESVSKDLAEGRGTLGLLINDEATKQEVAKAIASIRGIADKINNGEGTLGRLVVDPTMANDLQELIASVRRGDNTIGKLFTSSEIYDKLAKVSDDLSVATDALRNAKGSIGKLVMDDGLYVQIQKALATVTAGLEEYREAAPITAFTSVLFSVF